MEKPSPSPPPTPLPDWRASAEPRWQSGDDAYERRRIGIGVVLALLVIAALVAAGVYWWQQRPATDAAVAPLASQPAPPPVASAPAPAEPEVRHPIEAPAAAAPAPAGAESPDAAWQRRLTELLGQQAVLSLLQTDGFVRRVVVTVDNLGRAHAAPRLWPVVPAGGRFATVRNGDVEVVAPANAARYAAFLAFIDSVDVARTAALYKSQYPQFQAAYRELGYPRGYFNDRLVEVIDLMLATPEPATPPALRLTEVKGQFTDTRPWVRYEYADPKLESLSAGSRILLRMPPEQAQRVKAKLRQLRAAIAKG